MKPAPDGPLLRATPARPAPGEPIRVGVPFPRGWCRDPAALVLRRGDGRPQPSQWRPLTRWPDGSLRWALADFVSGHDAVDVLRVARSEAAAPGPELRCEPVAGGVRVETRTRAFVVSATDGSLRVLESAGAVREPTPIEVGPSLLTRDGRALAPRAHAIRVEAVGPVCATVSVAARIALPRRRRLEIETLWTFYADGALLGLEMVLRNPAAASHPDGRWDLGDPRSVLFRDLSVRVGLGARPARTIEWLAEPGAAPGVQAAGAFEIHQESSGGENWRSRNHVNRDGKVPVRFRGYRVRIADGSESCGLRASPVVAVTTDALRVSAAIEGFWQNFPKAIEASPDGLALRLFPRQFGDAFELQGGEQKTHRVFLQLDPPGSALPLAWVHQPSLFVPEPAWCAASGAWLLTPPPEVRGAAETEALLAGALDGPRSFYAKREVIDEYGWRHFGDTWADHEERYFRGESPVVSHYNNQYDLLLGLLLQFLRSGDARWFELARDLARHVADIDIYHTDEDKPGFNGGLFWHTDHYQDAHRATHRTYSSFSPAARAGRAYGGGPASEHSYAAGLLLFHYLTGDRGARQAALSLARWVLALDDGARTLFGPLDPSPTGNASRTFSDDYHGPGRGAGNSISVLLDGFLASGERRFLAKAEELILRCVHPHDDVAARGFDDLEQRWSYLVFLQALGKYLELKQELGEHDHTRRYAEASLLRYARWMLEHEGPYRLALDRVEFPTETWPAHDMRKSVVFGHAARHATGTERTLFREGSERYHLEALRGLLEFDSRSATRPVAIVLQCEPSRLALEHALPLAPASGGDDDFGDPVPFVPQVVRVRRSLRTPAGLLRMTKRLLRPDRLALFVWRAWLEVRRRLS